MKIDGELCMSIGSHILCVFCAINEITLGTTAWLLSPTTSTRPAVAESSPSPLQLSIAYGILEPVTTMLLARSPLPPLHVLLITPVIHMLVASRSLRRLHGQFTRALEQPEAQAKSHPAESAIADSGEKGEKQDNASAFSITMNEIAQTKDAENYSDPSPTMAHFRWPIVLNYILLLLTAAMTNSSLLLLYHSLSAPSFWEDEMAIFPIFAAFQYLNFLLFNPQIGEEVRRAIFIGQKGRDWGHLKTQISCLVALIATRSTVRLGLGLGIWMAKPSGIVEDLFGMERYGWIPILYGWLKESYVCIPTLCGYLTFLYGLRGGWF